MSWLRRCLPLVLLLATSAAAQLPLPDADRDGLPDLVEAALLEQFRPGFLVSAGDCDQLPAEFAAGEAAPRLVARNATIYAQATPHAAGGIELRYFHLWARDCGRRPHAGDVEHVAALLHPGDTGWQARYWYAAAHDDTVCDRSMAARAADLGAATRGPRVWISAGKHASYFAAELCPGGCGGDTCRAMRPLPRAALLNLGEPEAPLPGAAWAAATAWAPGRRRSAFDPALLALLDAAPAGRPVRVTAAAPGMQRTIAVSSVTLAGVETGASHAGNGVATAKQKTGNALQRSYRAVRGWLGGGSARE